MAESHVTPPQPTHCCPFPALLHGNIANIHHSALLLQGVGPARAPKLLTSRIYASHSLWRPHSPGLLPADAEYGGGAPQVPRSPLQRASLARGLPSPAWPFSELHYWRPLSYLYSKNLGNFVALGSCEIISICLGPWVSVWLLQEAEGSCDEKEPQYDLRRGLWSHAIPTTWRLENNYMDNQSIMPTWACFPVKLNTRVSLACNTSCKFLHINARTVTYPGSTGRSPWKFRVW